jgi:hypothetical protein
MRNDTIRYQLFLEGPSAGRFESLAAAPGASKSKLLASALEAWLDSRGLDELEQRFAMRLDRISNQLARIEGDGHVSIEGLALVIRKTLTMTRRFRRATRVRGRRP